MPTLETIVEEKSDEGNRLPTNGIGLEYTTPNLVDGEIEVVIESQDVQSEIQFWANALILYAVGDELSMNDVKKFMVSAWYFVTLPELYYNEEGYFLVRFKSKDERDAVLMRGPYTIFKKPVLLHEWTPNFTLKEDVPRVLPIWVIFPQLPLKFWGDKSIGKIASAIGKPLMTDECTARKLRVSYARVLIEVYVTVALKEKIVIRDETEGKLTQRVDYEWKPLFCVKCNKVGHICRVKLDLPAKRVTIWKPKQTTSLDKEPEIPKEDPPQVILQVRTIPTTPTEEWKTVGNTSQLKGKKPAHTPQRQQLAVQMVLMPSRLENALRGVEPVGKMILSWNTRGLNKKAKSSEIGAHLKQLQVSCIALLKTRVKVNNAEHVRNNLGRHWKYINNYKNHENVVYAHNQITKRKILWEDIEEYSRSIKGPWLIIGDFNNVLKINDRIGGKEVQSNEYVDLESMLQTLGLTEHDTRGSPYTWSNKHTTRVIYSIIYRALCNTDWFLKYPDSDLEILKPHISDQNPLRLTLQKTGNVHKIRHRFKFLNCTGADPDFMEIVRNKWNTNIQGRAMYVVWQKLLRLQGPLGNLNKKMFQRSQNIQYSRDKLQLAKEQLEKDPFNADVMKNVKDRTDEMLLKIETKEKILIQKAKIDWIQLGDGNNKYFYANLKEKNKQTTLNRLESNTGNKLTDFKEIEDEIIQFYENLVGTNTTNMIHVDIEAIRRGPVLSSEKANKLIVPVTENEIWQALKGIGDCKAPDIDGLRNVIGDIVDESQSAFVPGRNIQDNMLIAHVLVRGYNRKHLSPRCTIQMDVQKAYDTVEWVALKHIMQELKFPKDFLDWIMLCLTTVSYKYTINGQISKRLQAKRGLRQGDPISPLYDLLLFARGDSVSIQLLMQVFSKFSKATGLKANPNKCKVYFGGTNEVEKDTILNITGYEEGVLPFKYLGVPLSSRRLSINQCQPLVDKITARIQHWTAHLLSAAGRSQLVKSVLVSVATYWMQVFPLPKKIINHVESICRMYLWSGKSSNSKKAPIAWDIVCYQKNAGGLNINFLTEWNQAIMLKLL
ncbi:uncharacterized protein LOC131632512 [Vicia villosa]|uniref:uncharacterized protein LOC131632512 n=1 Tax=Vicia villosa TaxID=3911 RepID=UPI00273B7104|nr:uncharacterized protein LOC131632512 [Vicia villosa]